MRVFGLTGGIASGKSTVAARLTKRGVPVVDADQLAREVVMPGSEVLAAIVRAFGREVLQEDGTLDRKALARVVFADPEKRRLLNGMTHPAIASLASRRFTELTARGEPLACWEAALLVENGMAEQFRPLVVVAVPPEVQLERLRQRDPSAREELEARVRAQKPLAEKIAVADFVIETTGTLAEGARRTDEVLSAICAKVGVDPSRYPQVKDRDA